MLYFSVSIFPPVLALVLVIIVFLILSCILSVQRHPIAVGVLY